LLGPDMIDHAALFDPTALVTRSPVEIRQTYSFRDTILYALGIGAGGGADQRSELRYVYEDGLQSLPTMAVVLAAPGFWYRDRQYGIAWQKVLHAEQSVYFHQSLPVEGEVCSQFRISAVYDKGADKGALIYTERTLMDSSTGTLLASIRQGTFLRGNGGCKTVADRPAPAPHLVPVDRPCDLSLSLPTRPEQALIYRLSGDYNPLHVDPDIAIAAGLPKPILHGLATYGMAGRLDVRFSNPVFPGETIRFDIWHTADGRASFQATVVERSVLVLSNGYVEYGTAE
jgi:acyl dehydratase